MADVTITYKGSTIATMDDTGSKTLETGGTYCEDDIGVSYVKPSGGGATMYSGTFTPSEYLSEITIDALSGKTFTHIIVKMAGVPTLPSGNNRRAFVFCYIDLLSAPQNYASIGTNAAGTSISATATGTPSSSSPVWMDGTRFIVNANAGGAGYILSGVTYEWIAW